MDHNAIEQLVARQRAARAQQGLCIWFLRASDGKSDIYAARDAEDKARRLAAMQRNPLFTILAY